MERALLLTTNEMCESLTEVLSSFLMMKNASLVLEHKPDLEVATLPIMTNEQFLLRQRLQDFKNAFGSLTGLSNVLQLLDTMAHQFQQLCGELMLVTQLLDYLSPEAKRYQDKLERFRNVLKKHNQKVLSEHSVGQSLLWKLCQIEHDLAQFASFQAQDITRLNGHLGAISIDTELKQSFSDLLETVNGLNDQMAQTIANHLPQVKDRGLKLGGAQALRTSLGPLVMGFEFMLSQGQSGLDFLSVFEQKTSQVRRAIHEFNPTLKPLDHSSIQAIYALAFVRQTEIFTDHFHAFKSAVSKVIEDIRSIQQGVQELILVDRPPSKKFFSDQIIQSHHLWLKLQNQCQCSLALVNGLLEKPKTQEHMTMLA